jgi:hypothetical protein
VGVGRMGVVVKEGLGAVGVGVSGSVGVGVGVTVTGWAVTVIVSGGV